MFANFYLHLLHTKNKKSLIKEGFHQTLRRLNQLIRIRELMLKLKNALAESLVFFLVKKKTDLVGGNVIGSNVLNITLVVPIIGFFSNVQLDQVLLSRDYTVMISATIIFMLVVLFYSNKVFSIKLIRFIGVLFVSCYILYLLILSNLI